MVTKILKIKSWIYHAIGKVIPVAQCPTCGFVPVQIDTYKHEVKDVEVRMASCPLCENVLNVDSELEIIYCTRRALKRKYGWVDMGEVKDRGDG